MKTKHPLEERFPHVTFMRPETCCIGDCVTLGNFVTLGNDVKLGDGVKLGDNVKLGNFVRLGNCVTLVDGVKLGNCVVNACSIHSAYRYTCAPQITKDGEQLVQLGCFLRKRSEWESDFWNNPMEFPEDSQQGIDRMTAFLMACLWLDRNATK